MVRFYAILFSGNAGLPTSMGLFALIWEEIEEISENAGIYPLGIEFFSTVTIQCVMEGVWRLWAVQGLNQ